MWYCCIVLVSNAPELVKITTSVGQPTTLFVDIPHFEITWKKEMLAIKHQVLPGGSLYITDTQLDDQGDYTMTAVDNKSVVSMKFQLKVINPQMCTG